MAASEGACTGSLQHALWALHSGWAQARAQLTLALAKHDATAKHGLPRARTLASGALLFVMIPDRTASRHNPGP